jgi:hypothetical protein
MFVNNALLPTTASHRCSHKYFSDSQLHSREIYSRSSTRTSRTSIVLEYDFLHLLRYYLRFLVVINSRIAIS